MTIDATFWVAVSFFIFLGCLIYLKVPQKINNSLSEKINEIRKIKPKIVFNALHGRFGEDGYIQSILDAEKIKYTHSFH